MNKIRKAVIPVAGMGTRFLPATKALGKEMLPIIDKPTIQYIVEEAVQSGIEEILFITSPYKRNIEDHFDRNYELESRLEKSGKIEKLNEVKEIASLAKIFYIRQGEPLGSGHAISLAKSFVGEEPFAVMYGDDLVKSGKPALKELIDAYEKYDANIIGGKELDKSVLSRYGIIEFEDTTTRKVKQIIEKPSIDEAPSNCAGLGRYIVKPQIFDELNNLKKGKGNEYQFTDALLSLIKKQDCYFVEYSGKYYDIGNKAEYIKATIDFALDREDLKEEILDYIKNK